VWQKPWGAIAPQVTGVATIGYSASQWTQRRTLLFLVSEISKRTDLARNTLEVSQKDWLVKEPSYPFGQDQDRPFRVSAVALANCLAAAGQTAGRNSNLRENF
jgi:hypothetical protein